MNIGEHLTAKETYFLGVGGAERRGTIIHQVGTNMTPNGRTFYVGKYFLRPYTATTNEVDNMVIVGTLATHTTVIFSVCFIQRVSQTA